MAMAARTTIELSRQRIFVWRMFIATVAFGLCLQVRAAPPVFTDAEQAWIRAHPVVKYAAAPSISPLEDIVDGQYRGLIRAYLDAVSQRSGLRFQLVPTTSWAASQDAFLAGRADLFPNASPTTLRPEVDQQLHYTNAYFASPIIFVTRSDAPSTFGPDSLDGRRVAIRGGATVQKILTDLRPGTIPVEVDSPEQSLQYLLEGRADASLGTEATLNPLLRRKYGYVLGVASMVDLPPYRAQMGVRASEPLLRSIVEKSLASITAGESDVIYEHYLSQADYGAPTLWSILHYRRVELVTSLLAIALLVSFAWQTHRERRRAIRSEQSKARFLATMSHEIRTPINAMLGSIEMLGRSQLDSRQRGFNDAAAVAAEALIDLLDNVLDLSKLDAAKLTLEKLPVDLSTLFGEVTALVRQRAEAKGLAVNLEIDHAGGEPVVLDPTRLRQVLNNLMGNAIKFTKRGCVNVDAVVHRSESGRAQLKVRITDTGVGIAPEQQLQLFKPYSQADQSTTREFGGTGLGLTICKELVELMGGRIHLDSIPDTGTTVMFELPVTLGALPAIVEAPVEASPDRGGAEAPGEVLVVEDHPANQALIREQLLELGVHPTVVAGGVDALAVLTDRHFDLVLMDCHMPGMDGYETTRRIRARGGDGTYLPIVAISASTGAEHLAACLACGMDGVLRKPLRLEELRSTLELWPVSIVPAVPAAPLPAVTAGADYPSLQDEDLTLLRASARSGDAASARSHAHRMRGAALMRDDTLIAQLSEVIETQAAAGAVPSTLQLEALAAAIQSCSGRRGG